MEQLLLLFKQIFHAFSQSSTRFLLIVNILSSPLAGESVHLSYRCDISSTPHCIVVFPQ